MPEREPAGRRPRPGGRAAAVAPAEPVPAPAPVPVRQATADDLDVVVALRLALLREHAGNAVYGRLRADAPARALSLFAEQLASPLEVTWLALGAAGQPIGILRCMEGRGSPLLDPPRYAYVASVYVVPGARRAGVLRALMEAAVAWSRGRGLDELRLHAAADNAMANAAWQAMGFAVAEHLFVRRLPEA